MNETDEKPKLFTLRGMAGRLGVPQTWLKEQVELGAVPAVNAHGKLLFSLWPTIRAVASMAEVSYAKCESDGGAK